MQRYSRAGLAHAAADELGPGYRMVFRPRHMKDWTPFVVERVKMEVGDEQ